MQSATNATLLWSAMVTSETIQGNASVIAAADAEPPDSSDLQTAVRAIHVYYAPFLACVGMVTNVFSIVTMFRTGLHTQSASSYVIGLLVTDMLHLFWIFHNWLATVRGVSVYFVGAWCHAITFVKGVSGFLSTWFYVALASDRFIARCLPERESELCSPCRGRLVVVSLTVTGIMIHLNTSLLSALLVYNDIVICATNPAYYHTVAVLDKLDVVVNGVLPCFLVFIFTSLCLLSLLREHLENRLLFCQTHRSRTQRDSSVTHSHISLDPSPSGSEQTRTCLALLLFYLLLALPLQVFQIRELSVFGFDLATSLHSFLIQEILQYVSYSRLSLSFWILLTCHNTFRIHVTDCLWYCVTRRLYLRRHGDMLSLAASPAAGIRSLDFKDCVDRRQKRTVRISEV